MMNWFPSAGEQKLLRKLTALTSSSNQRLLLHYYKINLSLHYTTATKAKFQVCVCVEL